jgi:hypothetical protein
MMEGWKTLIGAAVALVAQLLAMADIKIEDVTGVTNAIVTIVGVGIVVYGRLKARTPGPLARREDQ